MTFASNKFKTPRAYFWTSSKLLKVLSTSKHHVLQICRFSNFDSEHLRTSGASADLSAFRMQTVESGTDPQMPWAEILSIQTSLVRLPHHGTNCPMGSQWAHILTKTEIWMSCLWLRIGKPQTIPNQETLRHSCPDAGVETLFGRPGGRKELVLGARWAKDLRSAKDIQGLQAPKLPLLTLLTGALCLKTASTFNCTAFWFVFLQQAPRLTLTISGWEAVTWSYERSKRPHVSLRVCLCKCFDSNSSFVVNKISLNQQRSASVSLHSKNGIEVHQCKSTQLY